MSDETLSLRFPDLFGVAVKLGGDDDYARSGAGAASAAI